MTDIEFLKKKLQIAIVANLILTVLLFGFYILSISQTNDSITRLDQKLNSSENVTKQLVNNLYANDLTLTNRIINAKTESYRNTFQLWTLNQPNSDKINLMAQNINSSCLSSIDSIQIGTNTFTLDLAVIPIKNYESRTIIINSFVPTVNCYYFDMNIECKDLCKSMTGNATGLI